jgi:intein-encoded DNA endonuclease-like protein
MTYSNGLNKEYIAGFFDGEGCVSCIPFKGHKYKRRYVSIANKDKGVLELIQKQYGGSLRLKTNKNPCWQLDMTQKSQIKRLLEDILPYMIVKREGALECLKTI